MERLGSQKRVAVGLRRVHRRAGDHAVVVVGIALHLGEPLPPAGRAALPIRVRGRSSVAPCDELFADGRREMGRAMPEVDDAFDVRLAVRGNRKRRIERARARVAHVVLDHGVATRQAFGCAIEADVAGEPAAADPEHLAVPARRQPVDRADLRARDRRDRRVDLAKLREARSGAFAATAVAETITVLSNSSSRRERSANVAAAATFAPLTAQLATRAPAPIRIPCIVLPPPPMPEYRTGAPGC